VDRKTIYFVSKFKITSRITSSHKTKQKRIEEDDDDEEQKSFKGIGVNTSNVTQ